MKRIIVFVLPAVMLSAAFFPWAFSRSTAQTTTATVCGSELVVNGDFEVPAVTHPEGWNIFSSGSQNMSWQVAWTGSGTTHESMNRPTPALLEFHKNPHAGWSAQGGSQYVELDTDWVGAESLINGEDASVKISQTLATEVGQSYRIAFYTAPRPYEPENQDVNHPNTRLENIVQMNFGSASATISSPASTSITTVSWTKREYSFVATAAQTTLSFAELGLGDSYGMFLDSVSVKKECGGTVNPPVNPPTDPNPPVQPCAVNMIANNSFETPVVVPVSATEMWDIFPSAQNGIFWNATWLGSATSHTDSGETITRPATAQIEFHRSHLGWTAHSGTQYTELDSDWNGPKGKALGESANVRIAQTLTTTAGSNYKVSFYLSPRPGHANNQVEVMWGGTKLATIAVNGAANSNTVWTKYEYEVPANSAQTVLSFAETGTSNSYGMFLDTVSVEKKCDTQMVISCSPTSQSVNVGQSASFTASGSNTTYTWSAPGSSNTSGTGSSFQTSYSTTGTKQITLSSAGVTAICTLIVGTPTSSNPNLSIEKIVKNGTTQGVYGSSATAKQGDALDYWIRIRNTGSATANNVTLTDVLTNGYLLGNWNNFYVDRSYTGSLATGQTLNLGNIAPGGEVNVQYHAQVLSTPATATTVTNTAKVISSNAGSAEDIATVFVASVGGQTVNLVFAKKACNDTKSTAQVPCKDATTVTASREDYITYTLSVSNTGNATQNNFVVTDDLSGVLPLADMVDLGGGSLSGQVISYPAVNIAAGQTITKTFRVRVKYSLAPNVSYVMKNTYGNTVSINIQTPPVYIPPRVGAPVAAVSSVGFAGLLTAGLATLRRRKLQA